MNLTTTANVTVSALSLCRCACDVPSPAPAPPIAPHPPATCARPTFQILTVPSFMWNGELVDTPAVVAVGNGTRGAIFAAYAFAEHVLGVAPFHLFTFDQ